ncbi:MAG: glutamate-5-semialdehyde dehydrogenase [Oscillospiraceae bacterium]|jgi:glutamate-5-semialdehyde dehydrogenase|nr:glutamate-5-semialdehyde dehydrogenase [Oscillospiraceae bacterium]
MSELSYIETLCHRVKHAEGDTAALHSSHKNKVLLHLAELLDERRANIIAANKLDLDNATKANLPESFIERLTLDGKRITTMIEGLHGVAALADPIGEVIGGNVLDNGLKIVKRRVPIGTIGIIYESRPNVTVDSFALCLKSGNCAVLRGGKEAINTNKKLMELIRRALMFGEANPNSAALVEDTSREAAAEFMRQNAYIDALIPRGGKGLIDAVVRNSTVPVIQTGAGNCHLYVDESAELDMAIKIADNAKRQRPSVCNSIETLLVHEKIAPLFLPRIAELWNTPPVMTLYADEVSTKIIRDFAFINAARDVTDDDFYKEYNNYEIAIKVVEDFEEAVAHINKYGTKHSECIVTSNMRNAERFQDRVDAAAVYVNASTRFTDGFQFGMGAEIGISNQKLHARGPLGLTELTTYKYLISGDGQVRI